MDELHIDIETYSSVELPKAGVYAYTASPDFEVLLFAYAYNDEPVQLIDLAGAGERIPLRVLADLASPAIRKIAHNAQFERVCLSVWTRKQLDPRQWLCTAAHAAQLGLPAKLADVGRILLPEVEQKATTGRALIRLFCGPCSGTIKNGGRTRNLPKHDPARWEIFREYCRQDVVTERAIEKAMARFPFPAEERAIYALDQVINDRGVRVDPPLVYAAIALANTQKTGLIAEAVALAGLDNPQSVKQIKDWLLEEDGIEVESLNKAAIPGLIKATESDKVKRILEIRQALGKTSVTKYAAIARALGPDNRVRGLLQYYGAGRTGRWAGRLVQVQNLPQNHLEDLALARRLLRNRQPEAIELLFGGLAPVMSELIRTAFIPADGCEFYVADFSAIEARVVAWLAGEKWRLDVFATHGKIYEASASAMFHIPIEQITKGSALRQKGKVAELALGYGGGPNALVTMGALKQGLTEDDLQPLVTAWRRANPAIVKYWRAVEDAALEAVAGRGRQRVGCCEFYMAPGAILMIRLPCGRALAYQNARLEKDPRYGRQQLVYDGVGQERKSWGPLSTYSGKLTENITQAIARDCLAEAMLRLDAAGYKIVMHVHDEAIMEAPRNGDHTLAQACAIMGEPIPWAPGLLLRADGFACEFYQKD